MKITDVIYGVFEINEPVIVDLIKSKAIQRLKGIGQFGPPQEFWAFPVYTRYEHSIGVMLLLKKLGATLEEQIAGLLHDISHTAFSHVIDFIMNTTADENYHENSRDHILNSELPTILSNYGFNVKKILDARRYTLLERHEPDLCADRVDYGLREFYYWTNPKIVKSCIDNLKVHDRKIIFASKGIANIFGRTFMKCQTEHWGGIDANVRNYLFYKALKIGLQEKIISMDDFYQDDSFVMRKLRASNNIEIKRLFEKLSGKLNFRITTRNPTFTLKKKFRYVDPEYLVDGVPRKLSDMDKNYKNFLEKQRKINEAGINVKISI